MAYDIRAFETDCKGLLPGMPPGQQRYLAEHLRRFYATYRRCEGAKSVLSIGPGSGFVETALARRGVEVSVVDFPEMIERYRSVYDAHGFRTFGLDLTTDWSIDIAVDLVMCCEVIEHVPVAPSEIIGKLVPVLKPGGRFVITTPNLGRLGKVLRLALGRPILMPPEKAFATVGFENEHIHRREYVPSEIVGALTAAGFGDIDVDRVQNARRSPAGGLKAGLWMAEHLMARYRETMIVSGTKR